MKLETAIEKGFKLFDDGIWRNQKTYFKKGKQYTSWQPWRKGICKKCGCHIIFSVKADFCTISCKMTGHKINVGRRFKWKKGQKEKIIVQGYIRILDPKHPLANDRGRVLEHRHIMCKKLGRILKSNEHVHHINGNTLDNRLENLVVVSCSEHMSIHNKEKIMKINPKNGQFVKLVGFKYHTT